MDIHSLCRKTRCSDRSRGGRGLSLRRHPHVAAIRTHIRGAVHRLHARVSKERELEHTLERTSCPFDCAGGVTIVARDLSGLFCKRFVFLHDVGAGQVRQGTFVPFHVEGLRAL